MTRAATKLRATSLGSKDSESKAEKIELLRLAIEKEMPSAQWATYDIGNILDRTRDAHHELLTIYERLTTEATEEE